MQVRPDLTLSSDGEIRNRLRTFLPLWEENLALPESYQLDVPYITQEQRHYSGAACAQMVSEFHNIACPTQDEIMSDLGGKDFRGLKHESFEVLLSDMLIRRTGLLPSHYSPAIHIAPKMGDGIAATDFIRGYPQTIYIANHDFYVFKRLMLARSAPLIGRIHFTTDLYPMDDEVAQYLDVTGHAMVFVGYNSDGFIVHDPWNANAFGGSRGGANRLIPYAELRDVTPLVNCSKDDMEMADRLGILFEHLPQAVFPGRDVSGRIALYWPGIEGVAAKRWAVTDVSAKFSTTSAISFHAQSCTLSDFDLRPGQTRYIPFSINTGDRLGSWQISVEVSARVTCPTFPWVINHKPVDEIIKVNASYRVSVQNIDWFRAYAMT